LNDKEYCLNKIQSTVAVVGLVVSKLACAGGTTVSVGTSLGFAVGTPVGTAIAQATGLPIESIGGGALFAVTAIALVAGIRIVRRRQGR
jgi:hypothetical protein